MLIPEDTERSSLFRREMKKYTYIDLSNSKYQTKLKFWRETKQREEFLE